MGEQERRAGAGRAGVYERPSRRFPAWAVVAAIVLAVVSLLVWLM